MCTTSASSNETVGASTQSNAAIWLLKTVRCLPDSVPMSIQWGVMQIRCSNDFLSWTRTFMVWCWHSRKWLLHLSLRVTGTRWRFSNVPAYSYLLFCCIFIFISKKFQVIWLYNIKLLIIKNREERNFYEVQSLRNSWSVRALRKRNG